MFLALAVGRGSVAAFLGLADPWLNEPVAALRDGNPIFTAWSPPLRRGVRIVQRPANTDVPDLGYWLDVFGGDLHEPDAVEELVVNCSPAVELVPRLRALLSSWISGAPLSVSIEAPQSQHTRPAQRRLRRV